MHLSAHLDLDVLAHETDATVSVLLEVTAPAADAGSRPPSTFQAVLDRSGSMDGPALEGAKTALLSLVDRLDPQDAFGLVVFDDSATIVVPAGPLTDKARVKRAIAAVQSGGSTDLAAGYLLGLQEVRRVATGAGAVLVLISDGHANVGELDPGRLGGVAAKAYADGVVTSTLGYGLGYDERLLAALSRSGGGNESFAEDPDTAARLIAAEATGLLGQAAQAVSLLVRMAPVVRGVHVVNELPAHTVPQGVLVELGGLYGGETRKLVLTFDVPGIPALGLAQVAELELRWIALPALEERVVTVPVHVNVLPGDQAAGRVPDPVVRTELAFLQAQTAKRLASSKLSRGDAAGALGDLRTSDAILTAALAFAPGDLRDELSDEVEAIASLGQEAQFGDASRAAKRSSADAARKSRQRGRGTS